MPISVACSNCGKALKVKDEWAGRRATCPQCKSTFVVPGGGGGGGGVATSAARAATITAAPPYTPGKTGATVFDPRAAAAAKAAKHKANVGSGVTVSPGLIIGVVIVVLVVGTIVGFLVGPKRVHDQWEALGDKPHDDVTDVVSRGLECYCQSKGMYNPRKARNRPEAKAVQLYCPTFVMSMPDDVPFLGNTSLGPLDGTYHPKTGEVDATVWEGGMEPIKGSGGKFTKGTPLSIKGHEKDGKLTTIVNGKPMELVMPPASADDER